MRSDLINEQSNQRVKLGDAEWTEAEIHWEHTLISHRMSWYVASQSFLLTAFAIAMGPQNILRETAKWLMPLLGVTVSVVTWLAIVAAGVSMHNLRKRQRELHSDEEFLKFWHQRSALIPMAGVLPGMLLPPVFLAAWFYLWLYI